MNRIVTFSLFLLAGYSSVKGQSWVPLGPDDIDKPSYSLASAEAITVHNNEPYIIFSDGSKSNKSTVRKHTSAGWQTLGTAGLSSGQTVYNDIAVDTGGTVYITYSDAGLGNKIIVQKLAGTTWTTLGAAGLSTGHALFDNIAVTSAGIPYIAYEDSMQSRKAIVRKWDGAAWIDVGTGGIASIAGVYSVSLAIDNTGVPYIAFADYNASSKVSVRKFDGTNWVNVGSAGFSTGSGESIKIAINSSGVPCVRYHDQTLNKAVVRQYDGSTWQSLGAAFYDYNHVGDVAFDSQDSVYEAHNDTTNNYVLMLRKYNGSNWVPMGVTGYLQVPAIALAIGSNNQPYIATHSLGYGQENVIHYDSSRWRDVAVFGITNNFARSSVVALDSQGRSYVFSSDFRNSGKGTVSRYSNGAWGSVGMPGFTAGTPVYTSIVIDRNNVPYIAYSESHIGRLKVQKYDGTSWINVGDTIQMPPYVTWLDMALDTAGHPYVAYSDGMQGGKPSAMKFDGTNWNILGTQGFEVNSVNYVAIAVDKGGTPYVTYVNSLGYLDATVKKFNGVDWVNVGSPGVSPYVAGYTDIALDTNGNPYIVYLDNTASGRAMVRCFKNNNWQNVGGAVSSNAIGAASIAIDENNTPYVAWTDVAGNYETWARKYVNNTWKLLDTVSASHGMSAGAAIAVRKGKVSLAYYNYGVFVKQFADTATQSSAVSEFNKTDFTANLYPNPAAEQANLHIVFPYNAAATVRMYDITGRELYRWEAGSINSADVPLPLAGLAGGIYSITIRMGDDAVKTIKLVRQ